MPQQQEEHPLRIGQKIMVNSAALKEVCGEDLQRIMLPNLPEWIQGTVIAYHATRYNIAYTIPVHTEMDHFQGHVMTISYKQLDDLQNIGWIITLQ